MNHLDSQAHVHENKASVDDIETGGLQGEGLSEVDLEVVDIRWEYPAPPLSMELRFATKTYRSSGSVRISAATTSASGNSRAA